MDKRIATQVTLAKVKVGDYVRTTPTPGGANNKIVQTEHPDVGAGVPRRVGRNEKLKGERSLIFDDGTMTIPRAGTALMWVYKLDPDGHPLPEPTFPKCPTCGSTAPGCVVKGTDRWTSMHATRRALPKTPTPEAQPRPQLRVLVEQGKVRVVEVEPQPDTVEGGLAAAAAGHTGKRVRREPDGRVWIDGWTDGDKEFETPSGKRVHVTDAGEVLVLGSATSVFTPASMHATDEEVDARTAEVDESALDGAKCERCKGFGLVRSMGARKGEHYKTLNGAQQAMTNGNAKDCPDCKGTGLVAKRAA